jgi:hypothetical protein
VTQLVVVLFGVARSMERIGRSWPDTLVSGQTKVGLVEGIHNSHCGERRGTEPSNTAPLEKIV